MSAATTFPAPAEVPSLGDVLDRIVGFRWRPVGCIDAESLARRCITLLDDGTVGEAWYCGELSARLVSRGMMAFPPGPDNSRPWMQSDRIVTTEAGREALAALNALVGQ